MDEEKKEFNIDDVVVGDEPLADGLDSQPAAESKSELASKVPNSESAEHDQDVATKEHTDEPAHLFTRCIECKRTEWATIGKTYVPISLVPSGKRYEAACLMVMCGDRSFSSGCGRGDSFGGVAGGRSGSFDVCLSIRLASL